MFSPLSLLLSSFFLPITHCSGRKGDKERRDVLFCWERTVWINGGCAASARDSAQSLLLRWRKISRNLQSYTFLQCHFHVPRSFSSLSAHIFSFVEISLYIASSLSRTFHIFSLSASTGRLPVDHLELVEWGGRGVSVGVIYGILRGDSDRQSSRNRGREGKKREGLQFSQATLSASPDSVLTFPSTSPPPIHQPLSNRLIFPTSGLCLLLWTMFLSSAHQGSKMYTCIIHTAKKIEGISPFSWIHVFTPVIFNPTGCLSDDATLPNDCQ